MCAGGRDIRSIEFRLSATLLVPVPSSTWFHKYPYETSRYLFTPSFYLSCIFKLKKVCSCIYTNSTEIYQQRETRIKVFLLFFLEERMDGRTGKGSQFLLSSLSLFNRFREILMSKTHVLQGKTFLVTQVILYSEILIIQSPNSLYLVLARI